MNRQIESLTEIADHIVNIYFSKVGSKLGEKKNTSECISLPAMNQK